MANLAKNTFHLVSPRAGTRSFVVKNATQLYGGSLVGIDANGYLDNWADTAGLKFVGLLQHDVLGDTSASPAVEGRVSTQGETIENTAIAGTFVIGDLNALIYSTTGNPADCTKTAGSNVKAIGWASRFRSAGFGDVTLFTPEEHQGLN